MNPLFEGAQANDSKDLVNFIIMTLHEELNKIDKKNLQPITNNNFIVNQTNQQEIFRNFLENYMRENKSIISDIFYGATHTITKCSGCPYFKHNFESIFFLIFPLEEVRKFKLQQLMMQNMYLLEINLQKQDIDLQNGILNQMEQEHDMLNDLVEHGKQQHELIFMLSGMKILIMQHMQDEIELLELKYDLQQIIQIYLYQLIMNDHL